MKRKLSLLLVAIMTFALFNGCDQATTPTSTTPAPLPETPRTEDYFQQLAANAVDDVIRNFWDGDADAGTGHIRFTHDNIGETGNTIHNTSPWRTSMSYHCIYDMYFLTGDEYYQKLLISEANTYRQLDPQVLELAGGNYNWASDDCAWNAIMYLNFYHMTNDSWWLDRAIGLLDSVMDRWYNETVDMLYYKDGVDYMSYYESGLALCWLRIWEITEEQRFYDLALNAYNRLHNKLGRDDGLYYCEASVYWPLGDKYAIAEAGSSCALAGNMCMAALSAKFYEITNDQIYLDRVYLTNQGILKYYNKNGVLLNDRDAWTNATFVAFYVSEVLSLPDTEAMKELIYDTADSIYRNARTSDGYYGGSWQGPAEGSQSIWYLKGSVPQQCATTGTSVMMITAAALLEAGVNDYFR